MRVRKSRVIYPIAVILGLVFFEAPISAQKKGGGAPSSTSPGSNSGASGQAASAPASASNAPFEVEMLSYAALDAILDKVAAYACGLRPAPVGTVNTSGTTVTWVSGRKFSKVTPGDSITINGVPHPVANVTSPTDLVLSATAGNQSAVPFSFGAGRAFSKILILDPPTLQALQSFDAFYANAEALDTAFNSMTASGGAGAGPDDFADVTNAVAAAATASTSETAFTFTIQDPTAAISLLHHLQGNTSDICKNTYYGGVYTVDEIADVDINTVHNELTELANTRAQALKAIMPDRDAAGAFKPNTKSVPCGATPTPTGLAGTTALTVNSSDPCIAAFNNLDGTYNSFLAGLSTPNSATGVPALASIMQGYRLRALWEMATDDEPILGVYLSVAIAGGTQQDRKFLLTNLFTGDIIRYSGGVSVNVIVFQVGEHNSRILLSDLLRYRTPLKKVKRPSGQTNNINVGDNLKDVK